MARAPSPGRRGERFPEFFPPRQRTLQQNASAQPIRLRPETGSLVATVTSLRKCSDLEVKTSPALAPAEWRMSCGGSSPPGGSLYSLKFFWFWPCIQFGGNFHVI